MVLFLYYFDFHIIFLIKTIKFYTFFPWWKTMCSLRLPVIILFSDFNSPMFLQSIWSFSHDQHHLAVIHMLKLKWWKTRKKSPKKKKKQKTKNKNTEMMKREVLIILDSFSKARQGLIDINILSIGELQNTKPTKVWACISHMDT